MSQDVNNKLKNITKRLEELSSIYYLYFFLCFWLLIFGCEYLYSRGVPNFISNDSFQYLSIAYDIYLEKKSTGLINYALDLYYDELALFGYDFNNLKPYHFPSYSAFLSLFYHIYENHNFVIYFSQYLSFVLFSTSSFLVINHYCRKKTSLILVLASIFGTTILHYISDSGKEILCSSLGMMAIYLGLYHPKRDKLYSILILALILVFLSITRGFYLLLGFLIFFYRALPNKYICDESLEDSAKNKALLFLLIFITPLCAYIYCYYFVDIHLFIFDNRADIYGGKSLDSLISRISIIFFTIVIFFIQNFQIFLKSQATVIELFNLRQIYGIAVIGLFFYFQDFFKNYFTKKTLKISRLFIINLFFLAIIVAVSLRFGIHGYRLALGYLPMVFLFFYKNFFKRSIYSVIFIIFIAINFLTNLQLISFVNHNNTKLTEINTQTLATINKYNGKKIIIEASYFRYMHYLPLFHLYPKDIYFFLSWRLENLCEDIENYHEHKIDFDLIFASSDEKINKCKFINDNFSLKESGEASFVYLRRQ